MGRGLKLLKCAPHIYLIAISNYYFSVYSRLILVCSHDFDELIKLCKQNEDRNEGHAICVYAYSIVPIIMLVLVWGSTSSFVYLSGQISVY